MGINCIESIAAETNYALINVRIKNNPGIEFELWDDCNSHFWYYDNWGSDACDVTASWGAFHGRDCYKAIMTREAGDRDYANVARNDHFFSAENWEVPIQITSLKCDVYLESSENDNFIKLEVFDKNENSIHSVFPPDTPLLTPNTWNTIEWNLNTGSYDYSQAARIFLNIEKINVGTSVVYFDNLRLVAGTVEYTWDDFNDKSMNWYYEAWSDATNFTPPAYQWPDNYRACEAITHNKVYGATTNAGCVYMKWNASLQPAATIAKMQTETGVLNEEDWSGYSVISAQIFCSATNMIKVTFLDKDWNWVNTEPKRVLNINTWETIEWPLPTIGINWSSINFLGFEVNTETGKGDSIGEIYIDNIKRGW